MTHTSSVMILGARGSVPTGSSPFLRYGGATTCVALRLAGQPILLDAGTGLMELSQFLLPHERHIPLLLSHSHADHLLGLSLCPSLMQKDFQLDIYAAARYGLDAKAQVHALMSPPLWPVTPDVLPAAIQFHPLPDAMQLGPVQVDVMEGIHHGGVSLLRLSGGGKRVVFVTDCTLTDELLPALTDFARDCDLLLCDGQYSDEEWPVCATFGHSTWNMAARFGKLCGAKQVRIMHHGPTHTDSLLDAAAGEVGAIHPNCTFARAGEEIIL